MAEGRVLIKKSTLTEIGNAIREKTGKTDLINPDNMPQEIESIESGGGGVDYLGLRISGTEPYEYSNNNITEVGAYSFYYDQVITKVKFPFVKTIKEYAFQRAKNLASIEAPNVETIDDYTFGSSGLTSVNFPNLKTLGSYVFRHCENLEDIYMPNVETVGAYAFEYCKVLENISLPKITDIPSSMCGYCSELTSVNIPNAVSIGNSAFSLCKKLANFNFPNVKTVKSAGLRATAAQYMDLPEVQTIEQQAFADNEKLRSIYLPKVSSIPAWTFNCCYVLQALILGGNQVISLANTTTCFQACHHILGTYNATYNPNTLKDGYIYVPDNLVADYQAATNWSTYATQIKGLSQLPQEYADLYGIEIPEAPAGYTLTLNATTEVYESSFTNSYSIDGGVTWNVIDKAQIVLENVTQIKFQTDSTFYLMRIGTNAGGNDILDNFISGEIDLPSLTADATWYVSATVGGGYD